MNVPPHLLDELVGAVAEEVSSRVVSELAARETGSAVEESWRLLGLEEAAGRLGRSSRWVRERVKRGELAFVRLDGGALAFELQDLRAFAEARRVSADGAGALAVPLHAAADPAAGAGSGGWASGS